MASNMNATEKDEILTFYGVVDAVGEASDERSPHRSGYDRRCIRPFGR